MSCLKLASCDDFWIITHLSFFFSTSQLEKKQATPPFQPQITDDYGLDNFDTQFTSEPVQLTPDDEYVSVFLITGCPTHTLEKPY